MAYIVFLETSICVVCYTPTRATTTECELTELWTKTHLCIVRLSALGSCDPIPFSGDFIISTPESSFRYTQANIVKQIREFGLTVDIVPFYLAEPDVDALGQDVLAGVRSAVTFYWNRSNESRAFAARFKAVGGRLPTFAGQQQYSAVTHLCVPKTSSH
jgi:hypothetical protein